MKPSDTHIAFIGLGLMGVPMVNNLLKAGFKVTGFDLNSEVAEKFSGQNNFKFSKTAVEAVRDAAVTILMLPDSSIIDGVIWGKGDQQGISAHLKKGSFLVDMSSASPVSSRDNNRKLTEIGISYVDAPVSGGVKKAIDGTLSIIVGGSSEDFEKTYPLLEVMGKSITHVGAAGAAHAVKALNNYISAAGLIAVSESLIAAEKFGLDTHVVNKVFNTSTGKNNTTENKVENFMLSGAFNSGFSLALMSKDVQIALKFIEDMGCYSNLAQQCVKTSEEANQSLGKGADHTAVFKYVKSFQ
jgi:3-hydroxyisobutyrate dehydrogenase